VTAIDIVRALEKEKFSLAEDQIRLEGPIKELGLYHVAVHLGEDVNTEIKVWVVPASGKTAAAK
jgi:large subunit ribosomal protein L9